MNEFPQKDQESAGPDDVRAGFKKGFLWTAIPLAIVSIFRDWGWTLGGCGIGIALIVALATFGSNRKAAAGVLAGAGIGVVVMGLSCFVWSALGYKP